MSKKQWTPEQDKLIQQYRDVCGAFMVGREILEDLNESFYELAYYCSVTGNSFNLSGNKDKITLSIPVDKESIVVVSGLVVSEVIIQGVCQAYELWKKLEANETNSTKE